MAVSSHHRVPAPHLVMLFLALGFAVAYLLFFYSSGAASEIADAGIDGYVEVVLLGVPTVALLMGAMWLYETEAAVELHGTIVSWTIGMAILFVVAISTALSVIEPLLTTNELVLLLLLSAGFGASAGVAIGIRSITARHRQQQRARSEERARRTEAKRSQLEYLNQYLRHEVLNEANKISGYASLLRERGSFDDDAEDYLKTVCHSSEEIQVFIQSIRTILDDGGFEPEFSTIALETLLTTEREHIEHAHSNATITTDGTDVTVVAGELLNRVFRNLFENAIEHNTGSVTVTVSASVDDDIVRINVADNGDGIPTTDQAQLFDPPTTGDHGYGLFLTRNLVEMYNGRLTLAETGSEGTVFQIELMAATPASAATSASQPARSDSPSVTTPGIAAEDG